MTRDEAICKLKDTHPRIDTYENCGLWVNSFVALGMLKLDKPQTAREKFADYMRTQGYSENSTGMRDALAAFEASQK